MSYTLNYTLEAKLTKENVVAILKDALEAETGKKVKSVEFKVVSKTMGSIRDEYNVTVFEGATVVFENDAARSGYLDR